MDILHNLGSLALCLGLLTGLVALLLKLAPPTDDDDRISGDW